jgi:hypothetical protein
MDRQTDGTWPPAPTVAEGDALSFRSTSTDVSVSGDVLIFRMLFIRRFIAFFSLLIFLAIPAVVGMYLFDALSNVGVSGQSIGVALAFRQSQLVSFIILVLANIAFLQLIYQTMLLAGEFHFDRGADRLRAGMWRYSLAGLAYVGVRRQVSRTRTWTRWCFFLGFDHNAGPAFDRLNPLHRIVSIYGGAHRNEYYLGYLADEEAARRAAESIAHFLGVEFQGDKTRVEDFPGS